jgi:hypothetical protein
LLKTPALRSSQSDQSKQSAQALALGFVGSLPRWQPLVLNALRSQQYQLKKTYRAEPNVPTVNAGDQKSRGRKGHRFEDGVAATELKSGTDPIGRAR